MQQKYSKAGQSPKEIWKVIYQPRFEPYAANDMQFGSGNKPTIIGDKALKKLKI